MPSRIEVLVWRSFSNGHYNTSGGSAVSKIARGLLGFKQTSEVGHVALRIHSPDATYYLSLYGPGKYSKSGYTSVFSNYRSDHSVREPDTTLKFDNLDLPALQADPLFQVFLQADKDRDTDTLLAPSKKIVYVGTTTLNDNTWYKHNCATFVWALLKAAGITKYKPRVEGTEDPMLREFFKADLGRFFWGLADGWEYGRTVKLTATPALILHLCSSAYHTDLSERIKGRKEYDYTNIIELCKLGDIDTIKKVFKQLEKQGADLQRVIQEPKVFASAIWSLNRKLIDFLLDNMKAIESKKLAIIKAALTFNAKDRESVFPPFKPVNQLTFEDLHRYSEKGHPLFAEWHLPEDKKKGHAVCFVARNRESILTVARSGLALNNDRSQLVKDAKVKKDGVVWKYEPLIARYKRCIKLKRNVEAHINGLVETFEKSISDNEKSSDTLTNDPQPLLSHPLPGTASTRSNEPSKEFTNPESGQAKGNSQLLYVALVHIGFFTAGALCSTLSPSVDPQTNPNTP